jgi:hypothetical protein
MADTRRRLGEEAMRRVEEERVLAEQAVPYNIPYRPLNIT